jgi:photosystem II stability/assembly factor-like uncharacterized protein
MKTKTLVYVIMLVCITGLYNSYSTQSPGKQYNGKWITLTEFRGADARGISPVFFFDKDNGIGLTGWSIDRTVNGGKNWKPAYSYEDALFSSLVFTDKQTGWLIGRTKEEFLIMKTKNKGVDWEKVNFEQNSLSRINENFTNFFNICFDGAGKGWMAGVKFQEHDEPFPRSTVENGGIVELAVKGKDLKTNSIFTTKDTLVDVDCNNSGEVWAVGDNGTVFHYDNGWTEQSLGNKISFGKVKIIGNDVWIMGSARPETVEPDQKFHLRDFLFRSRDKGQTWEDKTPAYAQDLSDIYIDGNYGWLIGGEGSIYFTKDSGESWLKEQSPTKNSLLNIFFLDSENIWITGDNATVLKYQN